MHTDVGKGPGGTARCGVDPPIVVGLQGQPVLQVRAVQQPDGADRAISDPGPGLPDGGVEAVHEGHRCRDSGRSRQGDQLLRLDNVDRQGLLADDVLPGRDGRPHQRGVGGVRGADVHDVDVVGRQQLFDGVGRCRRADPLRRGVGGRRRRSDDAGDHSARAPDGPGVHGSHEPGTDDAGSNRWGHGVLLEVFGVAGVPRQIACRGEVGLAVSRPLLLFRPRRRGVPRAELPAGSGRAPARRATVAGCRAPMGWR